MSRLSREGRVRVLAGLGALTLLLLGVLYVWRGADDRAAADPSPHQRGAVRVPTDADELLYVGKRPGPSFGQLQVVPLSDPSSRPLSLGVTCDRVYAAADRILCLRTSGDLLNSNQAVTMDDQMHVLARIAVAGVPSRARISADGRIASWTVFVHGDSYTSVGFSTRTSVLDLTTNRLVGSLETFSVIWDGRPYHSADVNFWGVTVASDDDTFYASMSTRGQTYLVRGSLASRSMETLRSNVECPSLSPDGTRIVFKKRVSPDFSGANPWRLYVLDLKTLVETPLAETRSVDDQAAWVDDHTIAYSLPETGITSYDLWTVASDGTGSPRMLVEHGFSPAILKASD